jgi:AbrB family looped-hinge helix DNA binding protein
MLMSKISAKGQTTLPKDVRDALHLEPGDRILYEMKDGEIVIHSLAGNIFDHVGSVKPSTQPEDFKAVRQKVKTEVARRRGEDGR